MIAPVLLVWSIPAMTVLCGVAKVEAKRANLVLRRRVHGVAEAGHATEHRHRRLSLSQNSI
jgi:hypothetical protein